MITQAELKEVLRYDPDTGHFKWISGDPQFYRVGLVAGGLTGHGYILIRINYKGYLAHRLAWFYVNGVWPEDQIDHINHIRSDNRIINLRCVTAAENQRNRTINSRNTSGVSGVTSGYKGRYWVASISVDKELIPLGRFADKFEAICARKSANNKYGYHSNHGQQPKDNKMTTPDPSYEDLFYSDEELINNLETQLEQANTKIDRLCEALLEAATDIEYYANNNVDTEDELNSAYMEAEKYQGIVKEIKDNK